MPSGPFAARAFEGPVEHLECLGPVSRAQSFARLDEPNRLARRIFQALEYCQGFVDGFVHQAYGGLHADHSVEIRHIENLLLDQLEAAFGLDARECFESAHFLRLAPFFENALRVRVEQTARQRDFFLAGQRRRQRFPHEPGRLIDSVDHERDVCRIGRDGEPNKAVAWLPCEQEGWPRDDTVQLEPPVGAGLGFGSHRRIAGLKYVGACDRLALAVDHAAHHRPLARGSLERDRDCGGLARLDREVGGKLRSKFQSLGRKHVDREFAGGQRRHFKAAVGIGRRAALARHLLVAGCRGSVLATTSKPRAAIGSSA